MPPKSEKGVDKDRAKPSRSQARNGDLSDGAGPLTGSVPWTSGSRPLPFDPVVEAGRQWERHWPGATSLMVATAIHRAAQIIDHFLETTARPYGVSGARYSVLLILYFSHRGTLPLGRISTLLQVHKTTTTHAIDRLEEDGMIRREAHPTDRRTMLAKITPAGRAVVEKVSRRFAETGFVPGGLSDDELSILLHLLLKLRKAAGEFTVDPD